MTAAISVNAIIQLGTEFTILQYYNNVVTGIVVYMIFGFHFSVNGTTPTTKYKSSPPMSAAELYRLKPCTLCSMNIFFALLPKARWQICCHGK